MPIDERDQKNIDRLAVELNKIEETQNQITLAEFDQFSVLFRKSPVGVEVDHKAIISLSAAFIQRFNPYRQIDVLDRVGGKIIFTIPQLFIPIKDVSSEYIGLVNKFRFDSGSGIPKYQAEATQGLLLAIMKSQLNTSDTEFADYGEYVKTLAHDHLVSLAKFEAIRRGSLEHVEEADTTSKSNSSASLPKKSVDDMPGLKWE